MSATASASMNVCMHARVPTSREKCIPLLKFLIPFPQVAQERHRPPKRPGGDRIANTCHIRAIIIIISLLQLLGAPGRPGKTPAPETAPPRVAGTSTVDAAAAPSGGRRRPALLGYLQGVARLQVPRALRDCSCNVPQRLRPGHAPHRHGMPGPRSDHFFAERGRNSSGHGRVSSAVPDSPKTELMALRGPGRDHEIGESGTAELTRP